MRNCGVASNRAWACSPIVVDVLVVLSVLLVRDVGMPLLFLPQRGHVVVAVKEERDCVVMVVVVVVVHSHGAFQLSSRDE